MNRKTYLCGVVIGALALLAGCDTFNDWFKSGSEAKRIPGERISILALEARIQADPKIASTPVSLPQPYVNPDWPQFIGTKEHALYHLALGDAPKRLWKHSMGEGTDSRTRFTSNPVLADGKVFGLDTAGSVTALSADSGDTVWSVDLTPDDLPSEYGFGGGVGYDAGRLYVTTGFGFAVALDAKNGHEIWRWRINVPLRAAPVASGGRVFVMTHDNQLFALNADDGKEIWNYQAIAESADVLSQAAVAVEGDVVVAPFSSGDLVALRADTGRVLWSDNLARARRVTPLGALSDIASAPVIDRGRVFAISHSGRMVSVDMRTGERLWTQDLAGVQTPWVAGDYVYVVTVDAQVVCLTRNEGRIKWVTDLERYEDPVEKDDLIDWSGPVLAGDRLILVSSLGMVTTLSPYTGQRLGYIDLPEGTFIAPIVANRTVYFVTDDDDLIAMR